MRGAAPTNWICRRWGDVGKRIIAAGPINDVRKEVRQRLERGTIVVHWPGCLAWFGVLVGLLVGSLVFGLVGWQVPFAGWVG